MMVLVGSVILPHGTMIFDGDPNSESMKCVERNKELHEKLPEIAKNCEELYQGCLQASEFVQQASPDVIILHTPHGIGLTDALGVYINDECKGTALWNGFWDDVKLASPLDSETSLELLQHFKNDGVAACGIRAFSGFPAPLRWGEVVPMWFLKKLKQDTKFIIVTQKFSGDISSDELLDIGASLFQFATLLKSRVMVAISGDLSHRHHTDCRDALYLPHPRSIKRFAPCEAAGTFDQFVEEWILAEAKTKQEQNIDCTTKSGIIWNHEAGLDVLLKAFSLQPEALSCGIRGFIVLHGYLKSAADSGVSIVSRMIIRRAPTYYGMMVANFKFN